MTEPNIKINKIITKKLVGKANTFTVYKCLTTPEIV